MIKTPLWFRCLRLWWAFYSCKHERKVENFRDYQEGYVRYKCAGCGAHLYEDL